MKLQQLLKKRILLLDGAMGTAIMEKKLDAKEYGANEGCNEYLNLSRPDIITEIHRAYLAAGADIIETNTFAASPITLAEYGLERETERINKAAVDAARAAIAEFQSEEQPRFLAGSMGPTNKSLSFDKDVSFEAMQQNYYRQASGLFDGVDLFLVETTFDTLNAKAALAALEQLFVEKKKRVPIILSVTMEENGRMLAGQNIEACYAAMTHHNLLAFGINCALGPRQMTETLRTLHTISEKPVLCYPNAGLPLEDSSFPLGAEAFAAEMKPFLEEGWLNLVGGCCGTTPKHIAALSRVVDTGKRRMIPTRKRSVISGKDALEFEEENRPIIIGERTNVIGSRKFKKLISEEAYEQGADLGVAQVKKGAQIIDICLANPERNEKEDTKRFYPVINAKIRIPIMVDSTDARVIEAALKRTQGKSIINSLNFEDGTQRCEEVLPLIKKYGGSLVFGTIDEDKEEAMAIDVSRKLAIAERAYHYLTAEWGLEAEDIIFDPLVFPLGTGEEKYKKSAIETFTAIRSIKEKLPGVKTILGISNVSFGLPPAGRAALNAAYLYHATRAGLDLAIINAEKLRRYPSLPEEERRLAEDLLFARGDEALDRFVAFYREKKVSNETRTDLPLNEQLTHYIIEGRKEGLIEYLDLALRTTPALDIINGPLMQGMKQVGTLFKENQLIVSEVLQSAESMKAAVQHLEQHLEQGETIKREKILLATVKGDVHDIGKNLLAIILKNNGYDIIDLGIKVAPTTIIEAVKKEKPQIIGLSGLLVKSTNMMVETAKELRMADIDTPLIVGGAALTEKFTATKIAPAYDGIVAYAHDAMSGLQLANQIARDEATIKNGQNKKWKNKEGANEKPKSGAAPTGSSVAEAPILTPSDYDRHVLEGDLDEIFSYLNETMLYVKHLGLKGSYERLMKERDEKAMKLTEQVETLKKEAKEQKLIRPRAVYQFFHCTREGERLIVIRDGKRAEEFSFKRQATGERLCITDFVAERGRGLDSFGAFFVTCGGRMREEAKNLREKGEYLKSHLLQVLALESAEAFAELVHQKMRAAWGLKEQLSKQELFQKNYQGVRYSFGYPACPNLDDQQKLVRLLKPEEIGITLTDGMMMDPEASVSAIVFHHPAGRYFGV